MRVGLVIFKDLGGWGIVPKEKLRSHHAEVYGVRRCSGSHLWRQERKRRLVSFDYIRFIRSSFAIYPLVMTNYGIDGPFIDGLPTNSMVILPRRNFCRPRLVLQLPALIRLLLASPDAGIPHDLIWLCCKHWHLGVRMTFHDIYGLVFFSRGPRYVLVEGGALAKHTPEAHPEA